MSRTREEKLAYWRKYYQDHKPQPKWQKTYEEIGQIPELEIAYIAGLVDGEGSLVIAWSVHGQWMPSLDLILTHEGVIVWIASLVGVKAMKRPPRNPERHRPQYHARIMGFRAVCLAQRMLPYLHVKQAHASLFVEFGETYYSKRQKDGFHTSEIHQKREEIHYAMKRLNARLVPSNGASSTRKIRSNITVETTP